MWAPGSRPVQGGLRVSDGGLPAHTFALRVPSACSGSSPCLLGIWDSHPTPGPGPTCPFPQEPRKPHRKNSELSTRFPNASKSTPEVLVLSCSSSVRLGYLFRLADISVAFY